MDNQLDPALLINSTAPQDPNSTRTQSDAPARPVPPPRGLYQWKTLLNLLRGADLAAVVAAGLLGHLMRFGTWLPNTSSAHLFLYLSSITTVVSLHLSHSYRVRTVKSFSEQLSALFVGGVGALLAILACGYLSGSLHDYSRIWVLATTVVAATLLLANRIAVTLLLRRGIASGHFLERIVMVGANEQADRMIATIRCEESSNVRILGMFEDRINRPLPALHGVPILGSTDDLLAYVRQNRVDRIVVTLPWVGSDRVDALLKKMRTVPVRVDLVPHEIIWQFPAIEMERLGGVPLLTIANGKVDEQMGMVKRLEDLAISSLLLLAASPVLMLTALAIKLDSRGPVIFKQKRHGFNNQIFDVYKFRSMRVADSAAPNVVQATRGDARVTRVGRFIRKTSLDELPQLINVLKGDMSIVGPRPHAVQHNHQYAGIIADYFARHNVKPGITGWAQVNGLRGETDTDDKMRRRVEYDLHYIEHWSLWLDLKIILMTGVAVWFQDTAY
ncbi:undecaprenyl-phosphate glucose phosphotransferase [Noviherbaspirillum aridicola]|uniref:Undecaprenyl-phosphate glucose phosphotransferase n=1 Tax=Noviherbaspirillum aridicola TaxID=2849687 RepID=A0ABQ4Q6W2_9BURK|nr:undecaprenyl-phosphate glucose phosphotransferase [Noviherbaspirillum aridicola]GIZ52525.1 undecaprenyl-phosphate glucose phosphotransferase [Noviherbaspirillum aridicola]